MVRAAMLMLGPLLVDLAYDFDTSIAVVGQLAAATFVTWGITAPLVGPISDTYGTVSYTHLTLPTTPYV